MWTENCEFPFFSTKAEPRCFSCKDPFVFDEDQEFKFFYETCPPAADAIKKKLWSGTFIRSFVGTQLRPRIISWLSKFPEYGSEDLQDSVELPKKIQDLLNNLMETIDVSNAQEYLSIVKSSLFECKTLQSLAAKCAPFFIAYFGAYRRAPDSPQFGEGNDRTIEFLPFEKEKENDGFLPMYEETLKQCLLYPHLNFGTLFTASLLSSCITISKAYYMHIIQATGGLSRDQVQVIIIDLLTERIYDLAVVNFPKSYGTILTLRSCLAKTADYGRERLWKKLITDVTNKLLIVAEDTSVMLDGYAACVESLRALDPSCSIMHRVCSVIKEYLKKRPDTVKKIIYYITTERRDQLAQHLLHGRQSGTYIDEEEFADTNDEFLPDAMEYRERDWNAWQPDPPDVLPGGQGSHVRQSADVFNMLVSVYGSKEMFVKEYRKLLAERLTSSSDKDPSFEMRYLTVLKQRFNEGELQHCEVMLRDIEESMRVDMLYNAKTGVPINTSVISKHFWPTSENETVEKFPEPIEEGIQSYEQTYEEMKDGRTLSWMRAWGWVEVEIELGGVTVTRQVSNANAAVLYLFAEKAEWTVAEVAEKLSISNSISRRRLEWWTNQRLLVLGLPSGGTSEVWQLANSASGLENARQEEEEDEDQAAMDDANDAVDALETYWIYTRNYIMQQESIKAERMLKMYRLFSSPSAQVNLTLDTVMTFLFRKVKQNLLTYQNGVFRVVKETK